MIVKRPRWKWFVLVIIVLALPVCAFPASDFEQLLDKEQGVFVAASDYMKLLPAAVAQWFPGPLHCLGTDGFGRSDGREELRDFFEVDYRYIAIAALKQLAAAGEIESGTVKRAIKELDINSGKLNPHND